MGSHALDLELQDAYWELSSGDYVPPAPAPDRLLEDSDHLDQSWTATVDSLRNLAADDAEVRRRIKRQVEAFQTRQQQGTAPAGASSADATDQGTNFLSKVKARVAKSFPVLSSPRP
jgi:hypothetical protein